MGEDAKKRSQFSGPKASQRLARTEESPTGTQTIRSLEPAESEETAARRGAKENGMVSQENEI